MSLWEHAVNLRRKNGGGTNPSQLYQGGDFIYIGEYSGGVDDFDSILDKFVGGLEFSDEEKDKDCKTCPFLPQKKTMEWVSSYIKDYLKDISKYT